MKRFFGLDIISVDGSKLLNCLDDDDGIFDGSDDGCIICIPWVKEVSCWIPLDPGTMVAGELCSRIQTWME